MTWWSSARGILLFAMGAFMLLYELFSSTPRGIIITVALVLMGIPLASFVYKNGKQD